MEAASIIVRRPTKPLKDDFIRDTEHSVLIYTVTSSCVMVTTRSVYGIGTMAQGTAPVCLQAARAMMSIDGPSQRSLRDVTPHANAGHGREIFANEMNAVLRLRPKRSKRQRGLE